MSCYRAAVNDAPVAIVHLITSHRDLLTAADAAWEACAILQETFHEPRPRVRWGVMQPGDRPLYAYDKEELAKCLAPHKAASRSLFGNNPVACQRMAERHAKLFTELAEKKTAYERAEDAAGITAARAAARHADNEAEAILTILRGIVPATLADFRALAHWMLECHRHGGTSIGDDEIVSALAIWAGASA